MSIQCMSRITSIKTRLRFGDGVHIFYLEYRCKNNVVNSIVCDACSKQYDDCRTQYSHRFMHGLVSGPYGKKSKIYGSPWYLQAVKKYGQPPSEYIKAAIDARGEVYKTLPDDLVKDLERNINMGLRRKIRILKPIYSDMDPSAPAPAPAPAKKVKRRAPAKKDSQIDPPQITMPERFQALTVSAVEDPVPPKDVCEVIYTEFIKKEIDGKNRYIIKTDDGYIVYSDQRKFIGCLTAEEIDRDE